MQARETLHHLKYFISDFKHTGAVAPSSRYLAKDVLTPLEKFLRTQPNAPVRILEIGPGTGIFTEGIAKLLRPQDHFDIIERNYHFYNMMHHRFHNGAVCVYHCDILKYEQKRTYDYIFSSLPYETIPQEICAEIWQKKLDMSHPGTIITYYKYLNFNQFRCDFEKEVVKKYLLDDKIVFRNFPPARLFTLKIR